HECARLRPSGGIARFREEMPAPEPSLSPLNERNRQDRQEPQNHRDGDEVVEPAVFVATVAPPWWQTRARRALLGVEEDGTQGADGLVHRRGGRFGLAEVAGREAGRTCVARALVVEEPEVIFFQFGQREGKRAGRVRLVAEDRLGLAGVGPAREVGAQLTAV